MKSPAFQFYPSDWLGSQRVQLLTLAEEGAFMRLICYCWQHGSIPADPEAVAKLVGKGCTKKIAEGVIPMFEPDTNDRSRLVHERVENERNKQIEFRLKCAKAGRASGQIRKKSNSPSRSRSRNSKDKNEPSTTVERPLNEKATLQSSSSSLPLKGEKKSENGRIPKLAPSTSAVPATAGAKVETEFDKLRALFPAP